MLMHDQIYKGLHEKYIKMGFEAIKMKVGLGVDTRNTMSLHLYIEVF